MSICELSRMAQVNGYAVRLICELPGEPHEWHWDSTWGAEWAEPKAKSKVPTIIVRTSELEYKQPIV